MNRRGFITGIAGILTAAVAPAIVRADSLMRIVPINTLVLTFENVVIGDCVWLDTPEVPPHLIPMAYDWARRVCGHDQFEILALPATAGDKNDPLGQRSVVAWKANRPIEGWRERAVEGHALDPVIGHTNTRVLE